MFDFQTAGQAAYSVNLTCYIVWLTNDWNKKMQIIRYKKSCRFRKRTFERGAIGKMLHFIVRNANCLLHMFFGVRLEKVGHIRQGYIFRSVDIMWPVFFDHDTKGHVVEKAIGATHIEMKHPACCTAAQKSFFFFLNMQDFFVSSMSC